MANLYANDILDLVTGTFPSIVKDTMTNLMLPLQKYYALSQLFRENRREFGGRRIQEELILDHNNAARHTALFSNDVFVEKDAVTTITVDMKHSETSYAYDKRTILAQQDDAVKIYSYLKKLRVQAIAALHQLCEEDFWCKPDANDNTKPYGVFYSMVYSGTAGFNGQNAINSAVYGLDTSSNTYKRYRNYTDAFTNITASDFLDKLWNAYMSIGFETPKDVDEFRRGVGDKMQCYTVKSNLLDLKHLMDSRNENLGYSLDMQDGSLTFMGSRINWVPAMDSTEVSLPLASASRPFLMVNWDYLNTRFLKGDFMRDTGPYDMTPVRHNSIGVHMDLSWNTINLDRRRQALLAVSDPLS